MNFGAKPQQNGAQHLRWCMAKPRERCSTLEAVHG